MKKPIAEMSVTPSGENYLMLPAWKSLVLSTFEDSYMIEIFKLETGIDIKSVVHASDINRMIDEATGKQKDAIVKWCDFVTKLLWGEEKERGVRGLEE